jgi:O-antigen ligase
MIPDPLPVVLAVATGLAVAALLVVSRSVVWVTVATLVGLTLMLYASDRLRIPLNVIKILWSLLFIGSFLLLGRVRGFDTRPWEYLLLAFFVGRLLLDLVRPGFQLQFTFGGVGDGVFLSAAYFCYKKAFVADPRRVDATLKVLLYSGLIVAVLALFEVATGIDLLAYSEPRFIIEGRLRANSVFRAPEFLGAAMSLSFFVLLLLYWRGGVPPRAALPFALVLLSAVAASLYRGVWVGFAAGLVFLFLARTRRPRMVLVPLRLLAVALALAAAVFTLQSALRGTALYEERLVDPANVVTRVAVYRALVRGIREDPWLGHGTGTVEEFLSGSPWNTTEVTTPHNGYLSTAYENGAPLLLVYLAWFIALLRHVRFPSGHLSAICGSMLVMVLVIDFTMYFPLSFTYHSLVIIVVAAASTAQRTSQAAQHAEDLVEHDPESEPLIAPAGG